MTLARVRLHWKPVSLIIFARQLLVSLSLEVIGGIDGRTRAFDPSFYSPLEQRTSHGAHSKPIRLRIDSCQVTRTAPRSLGNYPHHFDRAHDQQATTVVYESTIGISECRVFVSCSEKFGLSSRA